MKLLSLLLFLCLLPPVQGEPSDPSAPATPGAVHQGKGLTVELTSEVSAIRPGQPFYAGLYVRLEKGWHIYWKNPGLAGVPVNLRWTLPAGWAAGEIEWPAPYRVKMAAINTHGFERDVMLMVKITPPDKLPDGPVTLKTKASWMCCTLACTPGFADLELTVAVSAGSSPAWHAQWHPVFESERAAFPVPLTGWKLSAVRKENRIYLTGQAERPGTTLPPNPVFFSSDNLICSHPPQVWTAKANGFEAVLEVSNYPPKDLSKLRGILKADKPWLQDDPRAVTIEVPVVRQ